MKKIILIMALLMIGPGAFSACSDIQCPEPYDLSSSASRFFSTLTGQKYLSEKIGRSLIKKTVKKNIISGNIKTDIKSFSAKDLKAGRFKYAEIKGKDVNAQGVHISSFEAKTLCDFNYIAEGKNGDIIIKENIPLKVTIIMTEEDINNTMNSSDYKRLVDNINSFGGSFNVLNIESTKVKLKNDKMYYVMKYSIPYVRKSKEVTLSADLRVENGQIKMANTTFENNNSSFDVNKFSKILNYINPLDFSSKILENKDAKCNIETINISGDKVKIEGRITILKDKD